MYRQASRHLKNTVDWKLIICFLILILVGWLNIYASIHSSETAPVLSFSSRSGKQFVWILTSLALAATILFVINPRLWEVIAVPSYAAVICLLVAVILLGVEVKGSRSWFALGPIRFQPAEISKITSSLMLAAIMSRQSFKMSRIKDFAMVALVVGLPMLIIIAEKETGSALVYLGFVLVLYREGLSGWFIFSILMVVLIFILTLTASPYVSILVMTAIISMCCCFENRKGKEWILLGIPLIVLFSFLPKIWAGTSEGATFFTKVKPLYFLIGLPVLALPALAVKAFRRKNPSLWVTIASFIAGLIVVFSTNFVFNNVLQDHQRKRIEVLLGMKEDPSGVGYNVRQSMIAIGSGGFAGKGYLNGTQTTYGFVPEQSTDFIFCTVGEEWGFIGCLFVILLYFYLIFRIIHDAEESREAFTRIYGYGLASCIFMHVFINIGMTIGLMPVIGIPLPFLSYGGSSLWAFTIMLFIFIALDRQEKKYF